MFRFTTGSPWAVYSSWLMWVSSSRNRASFNYHSSPKAKLVLLFGRSKIRLSTFDLVPICIFTFRMFPLTSEYVLIIWAIDQWFLCWNLSFNNTISLVWKFLLFANHYVTAATSQETLFAIRSKICLKYVALFSSAYNSKYLLFQIHQEKAWLLYSSSSTNLMGWLDLDYFHCLVALLWVVWSSLQLLPLPSRLKKLHHWDFFHVFQQGGQNVSCWAYLLLRHFTHVASCWGVFDPN